MLQLTDKSLRARVRKAAAPVAMAAMLVISSPAAAIYATEEASTPNQKNKPAAAENTGPQKPPGAASKTYTKNDDGTWENDKYKWDPKTGKTTPKHETNYSYNPKTKRWDTKKWRYDPAQGKYVKNTVSTDTPPAGKSSNPGNAGIGKPQASGFGAQSPSTPASKGVSENSNKNNNNKKQGGKDNNKLNSDEDSDAFFDGFFDADISNKVDSDATSGNASVIGNTSAGSAQSGDATAISNLINMLQSTWGWGADLATFAADIYGNVFGDITLNPDKIADQNNEKNVNADSNYDLDVNREENTSINNDVNLNAKSGNATVKQNTAAGDATTGDATAIANIVNLISSHITAGDSFLGQVNIHGDLNGDILLPPKVIDQLLAANNGSTEINKNADIDIDTEGNQTINNLVNADANSGDATVANNTSAGSATSGDATNKLNILNLTGREVVGDNAVLVFVNVFGEWTGLIMDAPKGSTAALLGGGIDSIKTLDLDADVDAESNQTINNDVTLNAQSGDATVAENTSAGNATSGDANTAANITNVTNSDFTLDGFLGILAINVFGEWIGDFGNDTEAGEIRPGSSGAAGKNQFTPLPGTTRSPNAKRQLAAKTGIEQQLPPQLAAVAANQFSPFSLYTPSDPLSKANPSKEPRTTKRSLPSTVELVTDGDRSDNAGAGLTAPTKDNSGISSGWIISAFGMLLGAGLIGTERLLSRRQAYRREVAKMPL